MWLEPIFSAQFCPIMIAMSHGASYFVRFGKRYEMELRSLRKACSWHQASATKFTVYSIHIKTKHWGEAGARCARHHHRQADHTRCHVSRAFFLLSSLLCFQTIQNFK